MIDSRASREGATIRRRRQCIACGHRFTTYEEIEHQGLMVLKRDGRHEEFSKEKLLSGVKKACQKRPVSPKVMEDLVEKIVDLVLGKKVGHWNIHFVSAPEPRKEKWAGCERARRCLFAGGGAFS